MFNPTHTINDVPVVKLKRAGGLPYFQNEAGEVVLHGKGRRSIEIPGAAQVAVAEPELPPVETEVTHTPYEVGEIALLHPEIAAAALRAATWPSIGEAIGYAETSDGHSATLIGHMVVRICERTNKGGRWSIVKIPEAVGFEVAEEHL